MPKVIAAAICWIASAILEIRFNSSKSFTFYTEPEIVHVNREISK